jgi:hypothetical protein
MGTWTEATTKNGYYILYYVPTVYNSLSVDNA